MSLAEPVRLAEGQVAASGAVLARAFADDPLFTHSLSDPAERERLMPPLMTAWTRYGFLFGVVDVTAGPVEASAIWLPPDAVVRTPERRERAGVTAVVSAFSDGARARRDAVVQDHDRVREAAQFVPHWYLVLIGVDPARQGLGLGSLLLRAGLSRVDQDGVECQAVHRAAAERAALPAVRLRDRRRWGPPRRGAALLVHEAKTPPHHAMIDLGTAAWPASGGHHAVKPRRPHRSNPGGDTRKHTIFQ